MNKTPYESLTPDLILTAIESVGIKCSGSLMALNSYENRVYQIGVEDELPIIAKFYRPERWTNAAILEEHQFAFELNVHEIPVIQPLTLNNQSLFTYADFRFALFPRQGGRAFELDNHEHLELIGRLLGRLHAVAETQVFEHRLSLNADIYGHQPYQYLLDHNFIPEILVHNYRHVVQDILQSVDVITRQLGSIQQIRLHGDCHAGNILWKDGHLYLVDLDDCLMGPAIQDIWMLLSGNQQDIKKQLNHFLAGYEEFYSFNYKEIHLIEVLRALRMIHYAGWLAKRWEDAAFPLAFPWFNTQKYWDEHVQHLREQASALHQVRETLTDYLFP